MAEQKHKIIIEGDGRGLKDIRKDLRESKEEFIKAQDQFGKFSKEAVQAGQKLTKFAQENRNANASVRQLTQGVGVSKFQLLEFGENLTVVFYGLMRVIAPLIRFTKEAITLGAELQVLKANFQGTAQDLESFRKSTAGTVTDANLIKLSNQATDLGISLKEQTILFSLAETAGDKYGGSVEENFAGLMNSTEGATKVLKSLGIQKKVYEEAIKSLLPVGAKELEQLDAEAQKQIRLQALLMVSGESYESATNKIQDNKDKLEAVGVALTNFQASLGDKGVEMFGNAMSDVTEILNNFGISTEEATGFVGKFTSAFVSHLDILVKMLLPWTNLIGILKSASEKFSQITKSAKDTNSALGSIINTLTSAVPQVLLDGITEAVIIAKNEVRAFLSILGLLKANEGNNDANGVVGDSKGDRGKKGFGFTPPVKKTSGTNRTGKQDIEDQTTALTGFNAELEKTAILYKQIAQSAQLPAFGANARFNGAVNLAPLNPRQRAGEEQDRIEGLTNSMLKGFEGMNSFVGSMLQKTGMMDSAFGQIVSMIESIIGIGKEAFSVFGLIGDIISFLPGGSVVSGVIGAVGGGLRASNFSMSGDKSQGLYSINMYNTLNGQKFLSDEIPVYNYKQGQKH